MTKKTLALIYNYDGSIPPLGIAYLSSYVKKYLPGWDTKIFCNRFEKDLSLLLEPNVCPQHSSSYLPKYNKCDIGVI